MTISISERLEQAFNAEESGELDKIIQSRQPDYFEELLGIIATTSDVEPGYRTKAIYALGRWGNSDVISDIENVLPRLEEAGRIAAIDAIGRLGTQQAMEVVSTYSRDSSPQVRKFVIKALSRIGGSNAQTKLREIASEDSEDWLKRMAHHQLELFVSPE